MNIEDIQYLCASSNITTERNARSNTNGSLICEIDGNDQD